MDIVSTHFARYLRAHPSDAIHDVAFTLQTGRRGFPFRRALVVRDANEAADALESPPKALRIEAIASDTRLPVAFLFPGQGAQYPNMSRRLFESEPLYHDTVESCLRYVETELQIALRPALFPSEDTIETAQFELQKTSLAQPALFIVEYALAQLWRSWGIEPAACIGHSVGEYVAACISGVLEWKDALRLVALRGSLMESMPEGAMMAVPLGEEDLRERLADHVDLWIAAVNGPGFCVVSGRPEAVTAFEFRLLQDGIPGRRLHVSHAFHSGLMNGAIEPFVDALTGVPIAAPHIPYLSNITGDWIREEQVRDSGYWARHVRSTVRFGDSLTRLLETEQMILLEAGPGRTLSSLARQHPRCGLERLVLTSIPGPHESEDETAKMLSSLAHLWTRGVEAEWTTFHGSNRRLRISLPTYPFNRRRYWIDAAPRAGRAVPVRSDLSRWFYTRTWRPTPQRPFEDSSSAKRCWLFFLDDSSVARRLATGFPASETAIRVYPGPTFERTDDRYTINPADPEHYRALLKDLRNRACLPTDIVHLWSGPLPGLPPQEAQAPGFFTLFYLAQSLAETSLTEPIRLTAITDRAHAVTGEEEIQPVSATVLGPCRVAGLELDRFFCRNLDLNAEEFIEGAENAEPAFALLLQELCAANTAPVVAHRRARRWVESFTSTPLPPVPAGAPARLRQGGAYVITGGLDGIGYAIAQHLANTFRPKLALIGRSVLPDRGEWEQILCREPNAKIAPLLRRIRAVKALEETGAEIMTVQADVADSTRMEAAFKEIRSHFGSIHGIVHAAGVPGDGLLVLKSPAQASAVLRPKVAGTNVLAEIAPKEDLDFLILFSSINSLVGTPGMIDYTAANAYLDAFARRFSTDTGIFTVSINWCRWKETGMAARSRHPSTARDSGISNAEGAEAFVRILAGCHDFQIAVSDIELPSLLASASPDSWEVAPYEASISGSGPAEFTVPAPARSGLSSAFVRPAEGMEQQVSQVWEGVFGFSPIGADDDFFELGGHSLLAVQLVGRLRDLYPQVFLTLPQFFEHCTVRRLSALMEKFPSKASR